MLDQFMILFSWLFIATMALLILVPYLRGRSDLVTTWNMFLAGSALFVGFSMITTVSSQFHRIQYVKADYYRYCLGVVVFYPVLAVAYYKLKLPRRLAGRVLLKWPPATAGILYFMLPVTVLLVLSMLYPPPIEGFRQIARAIGRPVLAFAVVLSFAAWYKQRTNPLLLATWLAILFVVMALTIQVSFGRRPMIGALLAIPIVLYWLRWRYRKPLITLSMAGVFLFVTLSVIGALSQVRHFGWFGGDTEHGISSSVESLKEVWSKLLDPKLGESHMLSQHIAESSLMAIHMYTHDLPPEPFYSIIHVLTIPIPRAYWSEKPEGLGRTLPVNGRKVYGIPAIGSRATWGPGIIGHGYHEGGPIMLVFYGVLFGFTLRFMDEILMRQSGNPYVLGCLAAASGHIIGWSRGSISNFAIQIIGACIMTLVVCWIGRMIFGSGLVYLRTSHLDATKRGFVPR